MDNSSHIDESNLCLTPREEKFSLPEKLKRSEIDGLDASLWEELCIAVSENEPQDDNSLLNNEEFKQDALKYKSLKLRADKQVLYPNKSSLKKSSPKIGLWISVAAAIVVLLIAIPAIIKKSSPDMGAPQMATTPDTLKDAKKEQRGLESVKEETKDAQNNPAIAQATKEKTQSKAEVKPAPTTSSTKEEKVEPTNPTQEQRRVNLGLAAVEPAHHKVALVASTTEDIKQSIIQTNNQDVVLFASADEVERIEVERPNFFDRLKEKSIVSLNRLRGEGTMVVREYDSDGKLTLYAVQSKTVNFEKEYTE